MLREGQWSPFNGGLARWEAPVGPATFPIKPSAAPKTKAARAARAAKHILDGADD